MPNPSFVTSLTGLFDRASDSTPAVERIEIPLIQRDYAQGRESPRVEIIRDNFLDVLRDAALGGDPVGLDFVYGEVRKGTLEPLDGQQRLTTLFLLHWYVASSIGKLDATQGWTRFSYATRPSARLFCERLVTFSLPPSHDTPSAQITDQPWYLHVWAHDPTIQAMLVVIDSIHQRFCFDDLNAAWLRLIDRETPAISFHLLPIEDMGSADDLYIKMNSRGKPLTEFENFKAQFEKILDGSSRADDFRTKVDGIWADVFWPLRGNDDIVDDEFLRYIRFIIELCEWRSNDTDHRKLPLIDRARSCFAHGSPLAADNLNFLFDAFDAWVCIDTSDFFQSIFSTTNARPQLVDTRIALFGPAGSNNPNLFEACCRDLDNVQRFGNPRKLLLYAVLLHRIDETEDFNRRLRIVRNLVEASEDRMRLDNMPRLLADVRSIIVGGKLEDVEAFNQAQLADEIEKQKFLAEYPTLEASLYRLENHEILRGSLMAFELDYPVFEHRSQAFENVFQETDHLLATTAALLTVGEYHRELSRSQYRFGSPRQLSQWRLLLTGAPRSNLVQTRSTLGSLLDLVADSNLSTKDRLQQIQSGWIQQKDSEGRFDWRYYMVKYDAMREGTSGIYASSEDSLGFSLCMLNKTQMNSYYRDAFLIAIARESGFEQQLRGSVDGSVPGPWFSGYATTERWMRLPVSDVHIRCIQSGFALTPPVDLALQSAFKEVCVEHAITTNLDGTHLLTIPSISGEEIQIDTMDRVLLGAALIRSLVKAGL